MRWLLTAAAGMGGAFAVQAQSEPSDAQCNAPTAYTTTDYGVGTCQSCHGIPPEIAPTSGAGSYTFGLSESWLGSLAAFKSRITGINASMTNFAGASDTVVRSVVDYLVCQRDLRVSAASLSFGLDATIGESRTSEFVIQNPRNEAVPFFATVTDNADDFPSVSNTCGDSVGAQSSCTVKVTFRPTAGAATTRTGTLSVSFGSPTPPTSGLIPPSRTLNLTGEVNPAKFSFVPGTTSMSARVDLAESADTQIGTVTNTGDATLQLTSIAALDQPTGANYSLLTSPANSCTSPDTLGKNESCNVWIRFTPSTPDTTNATVNIAYVGGTRDVVLTGTGTRPLMSPTSQSVAFGAVQQGVTSTSTVDITNTGNAPLTLSTAFPLIDGSGDFRVSDAPGPCLSPIPPAGTCRLTVQFTPSAVTARSANFLVGSNGGTLALAVSGNGVLLPEPTVTPAAGGIAAFDATAIGFNAPATRTITLANTRSRDVNYSVSSTNPSDFAIVGGTCGGASGTVQGLLNAGAGGGSCALVYRFEPTDGAVGVRSTMLTVSFTGTGGDSNPQAQERTLNGQAVLPLTLTTGTLNVSAVVDTSTTASLLLTNNTPEPLTLTALPVSGAAQTDFGIDTGSGCGAGVAIDAGMSCSLTVRFQPSAEGARTAALSIEHPAFGSPQAVALRGTGEPVPQGEASFSELSLVFAEQELDSTSGARTVSLTNTGTAPLTVSALTLGGANATDFSRTGSCAVGVPLAVDARCEIQLRFSPSALGTRSATLRVQSDARTRADVSIPVTGTGIPVAVPVVDLSPTPLDFGAQTVGGLYPTRSVRLRNTGTADLLLGGITVQGAGFSLAGGSDCESALVPGASCDIPVAFGAAAASVVYTGSVTLASNAAGSPHSVALQGSGALAAAPVLAWTPAVAQLSFGEVAVGDVSAPLALTLANQGPGGAMLSLLNVVGLDRGNFGIVDGADACRIGETLFEGASCRVYVVYAPVLPGTKQGSLQFAASSGSLPPALTLQGTGVGGPEAGLTTSVDSLAFGTLVSGSRSAPLSLTITSSGSGTLAMTALQVEGPFELSGGTCPALPFDLPAGSTCSVDLVYAPQAAGESTGALMIGEAGDPLRRRVPLSGTASKAADLGGGGCAIVGRPAPLDPTLWLLVLIAVIVLWRRSAARRRR